MTTSLQPPSGSGYPEVSQAVTILVLGILSIVMCQILGPFAWKIGNTEIAAIKDGRRPPANLGLAQAGRICGIVGTCLLGLVLIFFVLWLLVVVFAISASVTSSFRS